MCLNSWCTLEAMFRFLTFPPFCYVKIQKKKDDFASILTAWVYFVFAKKIRYSGKEICVLYVSSVKYIQITHIN